MSTPIFIKHMVCNRCIMVVENELKKLGFHIVNIKLGTVIIKEKLTKKDILSIQNALNPVGFELIDDKKIILVSEIKNIIINLIHYNNDSLKVNFSDFLTNKLHYEYSYISNLFSEIENITIEQYYIAQKIERVKELLAYNELSLNEIADLMNYSSIAHLSSQFKKVTGFTPSHFRKIGKNKRKSLDSI